MPAAKLGPSRWPLRTYFSLVVTVFLLTAAAGLLVVRVETRRDAVAAARAEARFAAANASADVDASLVEARTVVASTAANPAIAGVVERPAGCTLSFSRVGPLVGSINIVAPDGTVLCSSAAGPFKGYAGGSWIAQALAGPVTTGPMSHPDTGQQVFVLAAPVAGTQAIFAAVIELAPIAVALAERYSGPRGLELVVVSEDGSIVLSRSSDPARWAGAALEGTDFGAALGETERDDLDGTTRLYGSSPVESDGWQVHAGADKSAALASSNRVFERLMVAILLGLLVALIGAAAVYLATVRPIRRLNLAVAAASAAPLDGVSVEPRGPTEVSALAREFNRLTDSVRSEFKKREVAEAERDRMEEELARAQRLESLGQLAGGVAHDFNNMLGVILSYAGFVKEEVTRAAADDEARWQPVRNDVVEIETTVRRAAELTRQLLSFARCDVARVSSVEPNETISGLNPLLTRTLGRDISVRLALAESVWPVQLEPSKLEQVIVNLAVNARDAMPAGGTLAIDSSNIEVDADYAAIRPNLAPGRYVRLRVSDTGTGMDQAVIERAFEPLFTTKSAGKGTGLGLSTVYGIVTQAGGDVSIYSEIGHGTTFNVLLPATGESAVDLSRAEPAPARRTQGHETVLVVEDDQALMEVANRILTKSGYRTLAAADGRSAIRLAEQYAGPIEVLLTDLALPDMGGREVAESLARARPEMKVIYATGYAAPVLGARTLLETTTIVLEKPFPAAELLRKVEAALGS